MHLKLICPSQSEVWDTPANAGFKREEILRLLSELAERGQTVEEIDGDALTDRQRSDLYMEAFAAVHDAGRRGEHYRIRQVFGSRKHGGGKALGKNVPALIVLEGGEPVAVYPHEACERYETIRGYLTSL
jgi:hypothetical protein